MIIVLGSTGMLGRYVYDYLKFKCNYSVIGITRNSLDITNLNIVKKALEYQIKKDDIIINCIGITNKREYVSVNEMYIINSIFPHILDRICISKEAHFIHPSTDCVFTGKKGEYTIHDEKDEQGDYGLSKSIGENLYGSVIRVSIIGEQENRYDGIVQWCKKNRECNVDGYTNHYWNGITCLEWAKLADNIISNKNWWNGVRMFSSKFKGNNYVSKAELIQCISDFYMLNLRINPIVHDTYNNKVLLGENISNDLSNQIGEMAVYKFRDVPNYEINFDNMEIYSTPYLHAILDNALPDDVYKKLSEEIFSIDNGKYQRYSNPFENKYFITDKYSLPFMCENLWKYLNSPLFLEKLSKLLGIQIYPDEVRLWTSVHKFVNGDYLKIHTDAGCSPFSKKKKEATLGLYLTQNWNENYGCELEIWNGDDIQEENIPVLHECARKIKPVNNRIVIMQCSDNSWHGVPEQCDIPKNAERIFFTVSYISDRTNFLNKREKAYFCPRPCDLWDKETMELVKKRCNISTAKDIYQMGKL